MKIALVVPGGVDRSGDRRIIPALVALIRVLAAENEVHVFALRQEPDPGSWTLAGARIWNIGLRQPVWRMLSTIRREHRRGAFDVVQCFWSGNLGLLGVACAKLLGIPNTVHVAGGELICLPDIAYGGCCGWRGRLREAVSLRATDSVTAASSQMIEELAVRGVRSQRVPLGVDLGLWQPAAPRPRDPKNPVKLIHVGSLNRVKDQSTLLRALAMLTAKGVRFYMDIVGEDTLDGAVQSQCRELGLSDHVSFHGFLHQAELRKLMLSADIMVVSSRHEAGPVVVLEAAVCGVPTVGTRVGHIAEWESDASVAVPVRDAPALADAIIHLCVNEDRRLELASNALDRARTEDVNYSARLFTQLYAELSG